MQPGMRVAQLLNIAFDMCAWEVLGSMSNGCTLCIRGKTSKEWRELMKTVDIVIATPSIMGAFQIYAFNISTSDHLRISQRRFCRSS